MQRCDRCLEDPVIYLRYSGQHLCGDHFLELIRRRYKKEIRLQGTIWKRSRIGVALSGGKDSIIALKMLHDIVKESRDKKIVAITVDEGISGYRPSSIDISRIFCGENDIEWKLVTFREMFGSDLNDMVKGSKLGQCTICGILRRQALNTTARKEDIEIMVTGHNLDDMSQTVLMNVLDADIQRLARLGPHLQPIPGFIPRSMPLRTTPEAETYLSALLMKLPVHDLECPYAVNAKRGHFRDLLLKAEEETPGTRHSLLRFQDQVSPLIPKDGASSTRCKRCGEPVIKTEKDTVCRSCVILERLGIDLET